MTTLDTRTLNRALLARQLLLERHRRRAVETIGHLVGMQAQAPNPPYVGLWTRLAGFRHRELADALTGREVVRIALMRSTVHLVTAADCRALRPLVQPALERDLRGAARFASAADGLDPAALRDAARTALAGEPLTTKELGTALSRIWPERDPTGLAYTVRTLLPLVQVPPRGVWGVGGQTRYATAESWLGTEPDTMPDPDRLVLRYLAAYGPATVRDIQAWAGLTRLREVVDRLRPKLRSFRDAQRRELFDLPEAPRPEPDVTAPVRFLPEFDNILLSHADRSRIIDDDARAAIFTRNGIVRATFLVDGFVRGMWRIEEKRRAATLVVQPFTALSPADREAVEAEGARLLPFAADGAHTHDIRFNDDPD